MPAHLSRSARLLPSLAAMSLLPAAVLGSGQASAADFPDRPITFVVAYSPGGGTDTVARLLGHELSKQLNQSVVIDNRPGAGGVIGAIAVQRAAPDGYTLLVADPAYAINVGLMPNMPYTLKDFTPISGLTMSPLVLSVRPDYAVANVPQLIASAQKSSSGLSFSSAGIGSTPHMAGELLRFNTKGNFVHVPYKGSGPSLAGLMGGQLDFAFSTIPAAKGFIQQKRLRALATTGAERSSQFPDTPTVAETVPGFKVLFWTALLAPAHTPPDIVKKLDDAVKRALASDDLQAALGKVGETPSYLPTDKLEPFVNEELTRWSSLIKQANIKPE